MPMTPRFSQHEFNAIVDGDLVLLKQFVRKRMKLLL